MKNKFRTNRVLSYRLQGDDTGKLRVPHKSTEPEDYEKCFPPLSGSQKQLFIDAAEVNNFLLRMANDLPLDLRSRNFASDLVKSFEEHVKEASTDLASRASLEDCVDCLLGLSPIQIAEGLKLNFRPLTKPRAAVPVASGQRSVTQGETKEKSNSDTKRGIVSSLRGDSELPVVGVKAFPAGARDLALGMEKGEVEGCAPVLSNLGVRNFSPSDGVDEEVAEVGDDSSEQSDSGEEGSKSVEGSCSESNSSESEDDGTELNIEGAESGEVNNGDGPGNFETVQVTLNSDNLDSNVCSGLVIDAENGCGLNPTKSEGEEMKRFEHREQESKDASKVFVKMLNPIVQKSTPSPLGEMRCFDFASNIFPSQFSNIGNTLANTVSSTGDMKDNENHALQVFDGFTKQNLSLSGSVKDEPIEPVPSAGQPGIEAPKSGYRSWAHIVGNGQAPKENVGLPRLNQRSVLDTKLEYFAPKVP
ncbi:hypothetical protein U1Q18_007545, partial [Sarracenia purpurea var. burkii]